ncbi:MAG: dihydroxyacetone kinase subunit DhaL [Verrucomicrobium sp.]|nr:dihydroxyacetone kinase subunit DhaL [Verrucomicrobium sp.]
MSDTLTAEQVVQWLGRAAAAMEQNKERLTALDSAIGDGDHGANMARGFHAVEGKLPGLAGKDIGTLFKTVAMTLISTVGGASGPLYGSFFLQAAGPAKDKAALTQAELAASFEAGLKGITNLGKAVLQDKTMVDALQPAIEALKAPAPLAQAVKAAVEAAQKGAEATIPLVARKGRASYLGERSAGHADPGASSSVLLLQALAETVAGA